MVGPSLFSPDVGLTLEAKRNLRKNLRKARIDHVATLPESVRGLLFRRPPAPIAALIPAGAVIGLYHPTIGEAPTGGYARFFAEAGHSLALPRFSDGEEPMEFAIWTDPRGDGDLEVGPYGALQPSRDAETMAPDVLIVPLLGFTASGARLGQGGGHYDRWLADHPDTLAIGLAWDVQELPALPVEAHDRPLAAVVTPQRMFGPFGLVAAG